MQQNPYAPPAAPIEAAEIRQAGEMRLASQGQRFLNMLVDYVGVVAMSGIVGLVIGVAKGFSGAESSLLDGAGRHVFGLLTMIGYYVLLEGLTGRTLGKLATGTKVVSVDGKPATFGQIVGRNFARFIPFEGFSFLGSSTGWHDSLSRTRVIRTRPG
jgi:uncharacterized RDD family membrane protein YckC